MEAISLAPAGGATVTISRSILVNRSWGTELRIEAAGFAAGETFTAAFLAANGEWVRADEFIGVGENPMTCNLQSALLRET